MKKGTEEYKQLYDDLTDAWEEAYAGDPEFALQMFKEILKQHPGILEKNDQGGWFYYGRALAKSFTRDYEGALADLNNAIRIEPDREAIYYLERGLVKYYLNDYIGCEGDLVKGYSMNSELASNWSDGVDAFNEGKMRFIVKIITGKIERWILN